MRLLAKAQLTSGPRGYGKDEGCTEQHSHNGKGKDPLKGHDLVFELRNTERSGQNAEPEAHGVVLVRDQEEGTVCQDGPDEDVGEDTGYEALAVRNEDASIPVDCDECPCEGPGDDGCVDETRVGMVAEGEGREVEEVDDQDNFRPKGVAIDEEEDESKVEEVVEDEVRADGSGGVDRGHVAGEEMEYVANLQEEQDDAATYQHGEGDELQGNVLTSTGTQGEN